jgi:membrane protein insertase Oxa1/YidC/SpoIIIJ
MNKINFQKLYDELIVKYKEDPYGLRSEYIEKYQNKERFVRYAMIGGYVFCFLLLMFGYWFIELVLSTSISFLSIFSALVVAILITALIVRLLITGNAEKDLPYKKIRKVYRQAYLDTLYNNQFEKLKKTKGLESKWWIIRCYNIRRIYGF